VSVAWSFTIGLIRGYGVFISAWMGDFGVSMKSAQYIFTFSTIGSCLNSFVAPVILKNLGTRRMMLLASVGLSVSQAAVVFTKELLEAQILLGIVGGFFFNNFVYTSNIVFQGWMNEKRVFGNGIVYCGVPLGGFILNPLWTYLFENFSWKSTCLIQAGISLNLLWISLLLIECPSCPVNTEKAPISWSLFKSPAVIVFAFAQLLFWACYSSVTLLYPYLTENGYSYTFASEVLAIQSISEIVFRPILSYALNTKSGLKFELMSLATVLTALCLGLTPLASSSKALISIAIAQGFSFAFVGGLPTCIIVDLAGYDRLPTAFMIYAFVIDSSFSIGPLFYSYLQELFFSQVMFYAAACVGLSSLIFHLFSQKLST